MLLGPRPQGQNFGMFGVGFGVHLTALVSKSIILLIHFNVELQNRIVKWTKQFKVDQQETQEDYFHRKKNQISKDLQLAQSDKSLIKTLTFSKRAH